MKLCLGLTLVLLVGVRALTDEEKTKLRRVEQVCLEESGVDQEVLTKAKAGQVSDDSKLKKQVVCVLKRLGFLNDAGEINVDVLKEKLSRYTTSDEEADQILKKCLVQRGNLEEVAFATLKCVKESKPAFYNSN